MSTALIEPTKVAVLVFVAALLQVTIFSQIDILGGYPEGIVVCWRWVEVHGEDR